MNKGLLFQRNHIYHTHIRCRSARMRRALMRAGSMFIVCMLTAVMCTTFIPLPTAMATPSSLSGASSSTVSSISQVKSKLADLNQQMEIADAELSSIQKQVSSLKQQVADMRDKISATQTQLKAARKSLGQSVEEEYKNGNVSYISVLLSATSFSDFSTRLYYIEKIASSYAAVVDKVTSLQSQLDSEVSTLNSSLSQKTTLLAQAKEKKSTITNSYSSQESILSSLNAKARREIAQAERESAAEAAQAASNSSGGSSGSSSGGDSGGGSAANSGSTSTSGSHPGVVTVAKRYLGVPYVWGGTSPSGFDCSGLAQYCYAKIGISISRVAADQYWDGKHIARSALMPGDLVFFGSSAALIHHVGIYCGGGQFIEAPYTGACVRYASLAARSDYYGACRP